MWWWQCRYAGDRRMTGLDASSATWTMDEPYSALAAVMPPRSPDASFSPPSPGRALTPARGNPSIARNRLDAQRARLQPRQVQTQPMRGTGQLGMLACRPVCTPGGQIPYDSYVSAPGMVIEGLPPARGASPPKPNAAITSTQVALPSSSTPDPVDWCPHPSPLLHRSFTWLPRRLSQGYRHFRIVKTGPNEDETAGPLMYIATLELYGILIETAPAAAAAANTVASVPVNAPKPIIAQGPAAIPVRPSMPLSAKSTGVPSATATAATDKGAAKSTKPPGSPDLKKVKKSPATASDKKEKKQAAETSDKTKTKTNRTPVRV